MKICTKLKNIGAKLPSSLWKRACSTAQTLNAQTLWKNLTAANTSSVVAIPIQLIGALITWAVALIFAIDAAFGMTKMALPESQDPWKKLFIPVIRDFAIVAINKRHGEKKIIKFSMWG